MNLLVWDLAGVRSALLRGMLRAKGDRSSVAADLDGARMRLETGLYDGVVTIDLNGAPKLALDPPFHLAAGALRLAPQGLEWTAREGDPPARFPATLAGWSRALARMRSLVNRVAGSAEARVGGDGAWTDCRIAGLSERAVLIEPAPGAIDAFARLARRIESAPLATELQVAGQAWPVRLRALFLDREPARIGAALES